MEDEASRHFPTDRETLERESEISFFVAGGPGGQNRNKVSTGVRLVHRPSGVVVTATERRSQWANREAAFERLAERLRAMSRVETPRVATRPTRAARNARLEQKRRRALVKQARRRAGEE
jgi:protein subunit release factor B